jgi:antitoxin MazE
VVVDALGLADGDEIEVRVVDARKFEIARPASRSEHLARLRSLRGSIPADFVFDRDEANSRD